MASSGRPILAGKSYADYNYFELMDLLYTEMEQNELYEVGRMLIAADPSLATMTPEQLEVALEPYIEEIYPDVAGKTSVEPCTSQTRKYGLYLAGAVLACATAGSLTAGAGCALAVGFWLDAMADMDACLGIPNRLNGTR